MQDAVYSMSNMKEPIYEKIGPFEVLMYTQACPGSDSVNEDAIGICFADADKLVLMVSDGAGGYPKGEEASALILDVIKTNIIGVRSGLNKNANLRNLIIDSIESANQILIEEGSGSRATVTVCEVNSKSLRAYQVGDSGMFVCGQKGKLKFRTTSHSPVGYAVESGLLTETEALTHPELNLVSNLAGDYNMGIELGPMVQLDDRDTVVLASDGLFDNFAVETLTEMVRKGSLQDAADEILGFFKKRLEEDPHGEKTKYDDLSFIICRLA